MVVYYITISCKYNKFDYNDHTQVSKKDIISQCVMQLLYNSYATDSFISYLSIIMSVTFETWDLVSNPLFWKGIVIESFGDKVVVNRNNKAFWLKTVNKNIFEADIKNRLIKKKILVKITMSNTSICIEKMI